MSERALSLGNQDNGVLDLRSFADQLLETTRVEYVDEGVLLVMTPPGFEHGMIVRSIVRVMAIAYHTALTSVDWVVRAGDFQWDLPDQSGRFYVPDVVVTLPEARDTAEQREGISLVVEVTSPKSPDTVLNDRRTKPVQYAKAGIPLYLLVDQERGTWTLHALADGWARYQVAAEGAYGEKIHLPEPFHFDLTTDDWPKYELR
ncbi:Uma2 family endonuclease [Actinomadura terrae]|uniref:Uma2 family endonuclease n=1 Tax=Actinomadura terrae TaxID=604353 RepID=UPI001FA71B29|nr:Uma2 family endonuclease [Actinomadura terrae]